MRRKLSKLALFTLLSGLCAFGQTTSTITGTIRDLTQALVTSGKVTYDLTPSRDTTISGYARFSPQTITCGINGSGQILNQALSGACVVTMTTALQPTGSFYKVCMWPYNVKTACFTFYAVLSSYDWSTVVPTPTTSPAQNFVDIFSNQTISGTKTFTGNPVFSGAPSFTGNPTFSGNPVFSGSTSFTGQITSPTIYLPVFTTGIQNDGSGLKHARRSGCTTGATAGNSCQVTVTWGTPFADNFYTPVCVGNSADAGTVAVAYTYNSRLAASVNVQAATLTNAGVTVVEFSCIAIHD